MFINNNHKYMKLTHIRYIKTLNHLFFSDKIMNNSNLSNK